MARTQKPKVQIKRQKVWLGWANRIYIDGTYMGAGTRAGERKRTSPMWGRHNFPEKLRIICSKISSARR